MTNERSTLDRLPQFWEQVSLGDVCEIIMGQSPAGTSYNSHGEGVPLLNGPTEFGPTYPIAIQWTSQPTRFCRRGDILLCVRGATTGKRNIADQEYCIGRGLAALRGKDQRVETDFLWFALDLVTGNILRETAGSTFPNLPGDKLCAVTIPIPPLAEQRRIATRLREQLAEVARARAAIEAQIDACEELPPAHLRAVFNGAVATQWPRRRFHEVCGIVAKQVDPRIPEFEALPHVSAENIESGRCRLMDVRTAGEDGMMSGKYLFESGDVLYSKLRPYLRKAVVAPFRGVCSADVYPLRVNAAELDAEFTAWMLVGEEFTRYAVGESQRSRMPKLNREQLFSWDAPVPSLSEQREIVSRLDAELSAARNLREVLSARLAAIEKMPAALLREAFSGRL
jgi:type I restriction enzyme S subunit